MTGRAKNSGINVWEDFEEATCEDARVISSRVWYEGRATPAGSFIAAAFFASKGSRPAQSSCTKLIALLSFAAAGVERRRSAQREALQAKLFRF